ncbi:MAG: flagellar basal body-associated FliL family protein [Candidatus Eiseniibacteriota bacterium]
MAKADKKAEKDDKDELEADGAEDGEEAGEGEGKPAKKKKKLAGKTLVLGIILPLLVLVGGGAGAYLTGALDSIMGGHSKEQAKADTEAKAEEAKKNYVYYELPEILVNLNTADRKVHYLKISVSLELENKEDISKVQAVLPRIIDNFQVYLRELRIEDLRGSAGLYRLREELLTRVATAAAPAKVSDVLFKEMLVQ